MLQQRSILGQFTFQKRSFIRKSEPAGARRSLKLLHSTHPQEAAQIVGCAAQSNLSISARSGGHSYAGYGLAGNVVIDLSKLKAIDISADGTAKIQTGNMLGDVATTLWNKGKRALPHGSCPACLLSQACL